MRHPHLFASFFSATLILVSFGRADPAPGAADGEPLFAPPAPSTGELTPQEEQVLKRYDKNGDGVLDADELAAAHMASRQQAKAGAEMFRKVYDRLLEAFDANHTGHLSPEEQAQAVAYLKENNAKVYRAMLKRFDTNGDGILDARETALMFQYAASIPETPTEIPAPAPKTAATSRPRPGQMLYQRLLKQFDKENKGSLDPAEQAQAVAYIKENLPQLYDRLVERFDANGDGVLDASETATMFDELARYSGPRQTARASAPAQ